MTILLKVMSEFIKKKYMFFLSGMEFFEISNFSYKILSNKQKNERLT